MTPWKLPPKEKIYEAYSVLADERYALASDHKATIRSSDGSKAYTITWKETEEGLFRITSDDNASKFQGYTGYPIIALLMILKKIRFNSEYLPHFQGINWHAINKNFKNDYALAVESILSHLPQKEAESVRLETDSIYEQIKELKLFR